MAFEKVRESVEKYPPQVSLHRHAMHDVAGGMNDVPHDSVIRYISDIK